MKPSSRVSPFIRFTPRIKLGDKIIEGRKLAKHYDDLTLFENFNLEIGPKEKVAIIGTNGAGKTTLLKMLIKKILSDGGKVTHGETVNISYFPQDSLEIIQGGQPAIDWLAQFAQQPEEMVEKNLRSFMGKMLFSRDEVFKAVDVLSGGERARMILAKMMLEGGNILALDEPTNHLDLEAIEALNYALSLFENTIIFVSHDREFVNSLATRIIEIHDGQIRDYPGTLKEYDRVKERELAKA